MNSTTSSLIQDVILFCKLLEQPSNWSVLALDPIVYSQQSIHYYFFFFFKSDHVTYQLKSFLWLPISLEIKAKVLYCLIHLFAILKTARHVPASRLLCFLWSLGIHIAHPFLDIHIDSTQLIFSK